MLLGWPEGFSSSSKWMIYIYSLVKRGSGDPGGLIRQTQVGYKKKKRGGKSFYQYKRESRQYRAAENINIYRRGWGLGVFFIPPSPTQPIDPASLSADALSHSFVFVSLSWVGTAQKWPTTKEISFSESVSSKGGQQQQQKGEIKISTGNSFRVVIVCIRNRIVNVLRGGYYPFVQVKCKIEKKEEEVIHFPKSNLAEREKEKKFLHRQNHRHPIHPFFSLLPCVCVYWKYVQEEEEEKKGVIPIVYNRNSRERERP